MEVNVEEIRGTWNLGYSLDKHTLSSTPIGPNEYGHMQFDTIRPPAGEALYQLKYRYDFSQVPIIANQLATSLAGRYQGISLVIPMPPSKLRNRQPVVEIAREFARIIGVQCHEDLLIKTTVTPAMKDTASRDEKVSALLNAFVVNDVLEDRPHNVLIVDDLYDTGSSLEAATQVLRSYPKVDQIFVATVTRKR
ncbi:MAG: ComF family protein [Proteobacteria bacterium]|nr:ComF family protein [Pseudomonadota bacterium]